MVAAETMRPNAFLEIMRRINRIGIFLSVINALLDFRR
jgi:hypothetical protein